MMYVKCCQAVFLQSQFRLAKLAFRQNHHQHCHQQIKSRYAQKFENFLVLDFEATCLKDMKIVPQEIIEFPCIHICGRRLEVVSKFHSYIKPDVNPTLTPFCTELTGIMQEMVDDEQKFDKVLPIFMQWLESNKLMDQEKTIFVTSGDWDLQVMLPDQCLLSNLNVPDIMTSWINIKKSFSKATGHFPRSLPDMLTRLGLNQIGRLHSGIDDCHNICLILQALGRKGFIFEKTSKS